VPGPGIRRRGSRRAKRCMGGGAQG